MPEHAGAVDDGGQRAAGSSVVDEQADALGRGDVDRVPDHIAVEGGGGERVGEIRSDDDMTRAREPVDDRRADPAGAAGDDRDAAAHSFRSIPFRPLLVMNALMRRFTSGSRNMTWSVIASRSAARRASRCAPTSIAKLAK